MRRGRWTRAGSGGPYTTFMNHPLSIGQLWLLERMSKGGVSSQTNTTDCPEPVGMPALRGLEKRRMCVERGRLRIFTITDLGRQALEADKHRLEKIRTIRRSAELARISEEDRMFYDGHGNMLDDNEKGKS